MDTIGKNEIAKKSLSHETVLDSDCPNELIEYVDFVLSIEDCAGLYGLDEMRREYHRKMAEKYGLTEEETQFVCELDKAIRFCGGDLNAVYNGLHHRLSAMRRNKFDTIDIAEEGAK